MNRIGLLRDMGTSDLLSIGEPVQGFVPIPANQQVPFALASSSKVFNVAAGGDFYSSTSLLAIQITPSASNLTAWFNNDTTKTFTIWGGQPNIILLHPTVSKITISGTDASVEVGGM